MIKLLISSLLLSISLFANTSPTAEQIKGDFARGDTKKYQMDNFQFLSEKTLIEKGIYSSAADMIPDPMDKATCYNKLVTSSATARVEEVFKCPSIIGTEFSSSLYDTNLPNGTYTCLISEIGEKYRPFGYFELALPDGCKDLLKQDEIEVKALMYSQLQDSKDIYNDLYQVKKTIKNSIDDYSGSNYLNISDILLSAILSDTAIIDIQSTKATNRVSLHTEYNSQITDTTMTDISSIDGSTVNTVNNNTDFISAKAATIADVYAKLSDLAILYLFMMIIFFAIFGIGRMIGSAAADRIENNSHQNSKKIPFISTLLVGFLVFFPVSREEIEVVSGEYTEKYEVMKSHFQNFERTGYYLFMQWASDATDVIVDSEMDSLISRAGLSNENDIIHNKVQSMQTENYFKINQNIANFCKDIYNVTSLAQISGTSNKIFPTNENSFYAHNVAIGNGATYYEKVTNGGLVSNYFDDTNEGERYPFISLSACGKANHKANIYNTRYKNHIESLIKSTDDLATADAGKIAILKNLIKFQYELNRDYGLLGILGLPVTIMQTENIGSVVNNDYILESLKTKIDTGLMDSTVHKFLSSVPYLLVPGASQIYQISKDHAMILGGAGGAAVGATTESMSLISVPFIDTFLQTITGAVAGGASGKFFPEIIGFSYAYEAATTLLLILPILSLFLIGIARYIIIMSKIFIYHFISLFLVPVLFAKGNFKAVQEFTMKVLATMLEIPIFVLSVWIAMNAYYLMKIFVGSLEKRFIEGMLSNLQTSQASVIEVYKIYFFDGILNVALCLFSVVIIWKTITTTHTIIFSLFSIATGSSSLDNSVDTLVQENKQLKI
ncbi:MAG: hypothetical protein WA945_10245 [Arcobacteraceae bacterium]